jgi:hypothetical protein
MASAVEENHVLGDVGDVVADVDVLSNRDCCFNASSWRDAIIAIMNQAFWLVDVVEILAVRSPIRTAAGLTLNADVVVMIARLP